MAKILIDINVILDDLFKRDKKSEALIDGLVESDHELYITASMVPVLDYFLNKYEADKIRFKEKFLSVFRIISTTGIEASGAIEFQDGEDALIAMSFKRIAEDGIIVTNDKNFPLSGLSGLTVEEAMNSLFTHPAKENPYISMLDLKKEYRSYMEEIDGAVLRSTAEANYILGPEVGRLEERIAGYTDVGYAAVCSSGTEALVLALRSLAIQNKNKEYWDKGDLVITTPFTFTATGDAILRSGATPLFVDIDLETYTISAGEIEKALEKYGGMVKGIIPVHLYGQPCNMDGVMKAANERGLFVIEDCAQSFGAKWRGRHTGTFGDAGCFSFFPSKNLGCFGDGGAVTTNNKELAGIIKMLIKHGGKDKYNVEHIGYNARLDTLQASILLVKLNYISEFTERRRGIAGAYNEGLEVLTGLKDLTSLNIPREAENSYHVYHQYTIAVKNGNREGLQNYLKENGVSTIVYYPVPLHKMKVFEGRCEMYGKLKNAEEASKIVLSLPIEPLQTKGDIKHIVSVIKNYVNA